MSEEINLLTNEEIHRKIVRAKKIITEYKKNHNIEESKLKVLYNNLTILKKIILENNKNNQQQPTSETIDLAHKQIKEHLGEDECNETIRLERWEENVTCPYCSSIKILKIDNTNQKLEHNFTYQCSDCEKLFNDYTGTPFEDGVPSIQTWMEVWYLFGCTDSINYISAKMHLDPELVKLMLNLLKKVFGDKQPLTKLGETFEQWHDRYSFLEKSIKTNLINQENVRVGKGVTDSAKEKYDTAEYRRQKKSIKPQNKPKN